jgi:hypothetical protein
MIRRTGGSCPPLGVPSGLRLTRLSRLNEDRDLLFALRSEWRVVPVAPSVPQLNPDILAIMRSSEGQPVDPWSMVTDRGSPDHETFTASQCDG